MSVRLYQALADAFAPPAQAPSAAPSGWEEDSKGRQRIFTPARTLVHDEQSSTTLLEIPPLAPAFAEGWQAERAIIRPIARTTPHDEQSSGTLLSTPPLRFPFPEGWQAERFRLYPLARTTPRDEQSSGSILAVPPLAPPFKDGWQSSDVKPRKPSATLAFDTPLIFRIVAAPVSFPEGWQAESYRRPPVPTRQPADVGPAAAVILAVPPLAPAFPEGWYAHRAVIWPVSRTITHNEPASGTIFVVPPVLLSPDIIFTEPTRPLTFTEPARNLVFIEPARPLDFVGGP